jgi:LL-diaminopimelate aminotransferase
MTGWRIGMAVGNPDLIAAISKVKENTDSGIFNAVQFAGIQALRNETNIDRCSASTRGGGRVLKTLAKIGIAFNPPKDLLPWVHAGDGSLEFTNLSFEKAAVVSRRAPPTASTAGVHPISLTVPDARWRRRWSNRKAWVNVA